MNHDRWISFAHHQAWIVGLDGQRDDELSECLSKAVGELSAVTQSRAVKFITGYLNAATRGGGDDPDAPISASIEDCRIWLSRYLEDLGYTIRASSRSDGSVLVSPGERLCISAASVGLNALGRLYRHLRLIGVRRDHDPTRVDDFETWDPEQKLAMKELIYVGRRNLQKIAYYGSQFVCVLADAHVPRMDDAAGLGSRVLKAGRDFGWPRAIQDLVTVMAEDGPRFCDTHALTAEDWALGSSPAGFGQVLQAPNKGSKGERVKTIVISSIMRSQLEETFNRDPSRPNVAELNALLEAGDFEALRKICLFPSQRGTPYSYSCYNNRYFRPAMEAGQVMIRNSRGIVRATGHRLRSGRIQDEADEIFAFGKNDHQIDLGTTRLKRDVSLTSRAIKRYIGPAAQVQSDREKIERLEKRLARIRQSRVVEGATVSFDPVARRVAAHR